MFDLSLTIKRWSAWTSGVSAPAEWQLWAEDRLVNPQDSAPDVRAIPPMLRRRLSPLGKMALSVVVPLLNDEQSIPSVFCSRHGELERTVSLLNELAAEAPLSPTQFSLSVHNAIGGILSIVRKDMSPITAIAASDNGLNNALLEAHAILTVGEHKEVLCVVYDEPVPGVYDLNDGVPSRAYAAAFIVAGNPEAEGEQGLQLKVSSDGSKHCSDKAGTAKKEEQVFSFLRFLLTPHSRSLLLDSRRNQWHWSKLEVSDVSV